MRFRTPTGIMVVGPSGSGKTVFVNRLLHDAAYHFPRAPHGNIHYCYGAEQPLFKEMARRDGITFHEGVPTLDDVKKWFDRQGGGILVMDDLMDASSRNQFVSDLFTKHSHHRNVTVIYLLQDLFPPGKYAKGISRNVHYIVVFKNPRDKVAMRTLLLQAFPSRWEQVMDKYEEVTKRPYSYLLLDLHPHSPDDYRLYTDILKDGDRHWSSVFVRREQTQQQQQTPQTEGRRKRKVDGSSVESRCDARAAGGRRCRKCEGRRRRRRGRRTPSDTV